MADKKYQVFISSTYSDLKEERRKILDVLLMADCIPSGMEAFVATDNEQFDVIKKVIDLCDYYILIIGKRYGSISPLTGKSYTEMEYDYAVSKDIPVLVFAIDETVELPIEKTETSKTRVAALYKFRRKAMNSRLASIWKTTDELTGALGVSIMQVKERFPRQGWARSSQEEQIIGILQNDLDAVKTRLTQTTDALNKKEKDLQKIKSEMQTVLDEKAILVSKFEDYKKESTQVQEQLKTKLNSETIKLKKAHVTENGKASDALASTKIELQELINQNSSLLSANEELRNLIEKNEEEYKKDLLLMQMQLKSVQNDHNLNSNTMPTATMPTANYLKNQEKFIDLWEASYGNKQSIVQNVLTVEGTRENVTIYKIYATIAKNTQGWINKKTAASTLRQYIFNNPHFEMFRLTYDYCEDLLMKFEHLGMIQLYQSKHADVKNYELTDLGEKFITNNNSYYYAP